MLPIINIDFELLGSLTNTGNNRASTERCREGDSENASIAKQIIGGVVPLQPAWRYLEHLEMCTIPGNPKYTLHFLATLSTH